LVACGPSAVDAGASDAGGGDGWGGDDAAFDAAMTEGAVDADPADASGNLGRSNDASPPNDGASDAGVLCPLPPTRCIGTTWQVYYSGGTCQNGLCVFTSHVVSCPEGCAVNGRCGPLPPVSE
jgi:hypothetical protein